MDKQYKKYQRLRRRFDLAAQNFAWKGAAHPDDREGIEYEYHAAKKALDKYVKECLDDMAWTLANTPN